MLQTDSLQSMSRLVRLSSVCVSTEKVFPEVNSTVRARLSSLSEGLGVAPTKCHTHSTVSLKVSGRPDKIVTSTEVVLDPRRICLFLADTFCFHIREHGFIGWAFLAFFLAPGLLSIPTKQWVQVVDLLSFTIISECLIGASMLAMMANAVPYGILPSCSLLRGGWQIAGVHPESRLQSRLCVPTTNPQHEKP